MELRRARRERGAGFALGCPVRRPDDRVPHVLRDPVRSAEVLPAKWTQVDLKAGELRLEPGKTKNREDRVFPFTTGLVSALRL